MGDLLDDPNREAVGLDPVWVEGSGGGKKGKARGRPKKEAEEPKPETPADSEGTPSG